MNAILRDFVQSFLTFLERVGLLVRFALRLFAILPSALLRVRPIIEQVYNTGAMSLVIIMTCGLFVGMVLGLQGYDLLTRFGSEEYLGTATAVSLLRELGPVVTALLFAGRAGTALAAELGLRLTYMEVRMLVDDLKLKLKDPEVPKPVAPLAAPNPPVPNPAPNVVDESKKAS